MSYPPARAQDSAASLTLPESVAAVARSARSLERQGLYDPRHEHDACGMGFVVDLSGNKSHDIIEKGIQILINLTHRGACGCDPGTGDGAGITIQIPHAFFQKECEKLGF